MTRRGVFSSRAHFLDGVRPDDLRSLGFVGEEVVHLGDGAVEDGDLVAVVVHVQHQVLAHDRQSDQSDIAICFRHVGTPFQSTPRDIPDRSVGSKDSGHGKLLTSRCFEF